MDTWKFYDIAHREHMVCNPTSDDKLARLVGLPRLPAKAHVVDIACGKGEFLIRLAEAYRIRDWDRYEGLQWYATAEYAGCHSDDPDLPEILERVAKAKAAYLRWGRDTLGWAMYVFRQLATTAA